MATVLTITYGTWVAMTVTNLQSLLADSSDAFTAWQSDRVDNQTTTKADDYEIRLHLPTTADAAANDAASYIYVVPWVYDGSAWAAGGNFGTTTLPTGTEGTASVSDPNSMRLGAVVPYKITSQIMQGYIPLASLFGGLAPDGWSLAIRTNHCAVAAGKGLSTGCVVAYRPITYTQT